MSEEGKDLPTAEVEAKGRLARALGAIWSEEPLVPRLERVALRLASLLSARWGLHLSVALAVMLVALARGTGFWGEKAVFVPATEAGEEYELPAGFNVEPLDSGGFLLRVPVPRTIIPIRPREGTLYYTVQADDTLYGIAERFGINADTIAWANPEVEEHRNLLAMGEKLVIPPIDGVLHAVQANDTLESIATKYKVSASAIAQFEFNNLGDPPNLKVGQKVMVPGGRKPPPPTPVPKPNPPTPKPAPATRATASGRFVWPTSGRITQNYWSRHRAIDIGAPKGTPIYAADGGRVAEAGWSDVGYGYYLVIDHGNGFQTLYAHLSHYEVDVGQPVRQGQFIARVGSTGRSTGPHLHFEIVYNGEKRNPRAYLP